MWSVNCILGILSIWANIHLLVSAYHVCSFVMNNELMEFLDKWMELENIILTEVTWVNIFEIGEWPHPSTVNRA